MRSDWMNYLVFLVMVIFMACGMSEEEMVTLAKTEYERQVKILEIEQSKLCFKSALAIAEDKADSIIYFLRINPLKEDLYRPDVPDKPDFVPTDSLLINSKQTVKPIIERDHQ